MFDVYIIIGGLGTSKEYFKCMMKGIKTRSLDSLVCFYEFKIDKSIDHYEDVYNFIEVYKKNKYIRNIIVVAFSLGCNLIVFNEKLRQNKIYNKLYLLDPPLPLDEDYNYLFRYPVLYRILFKMSNSISIISHLINLILLKFENKNTPYIVNKYILSNTYDDIIDCINKYYFVCMDFSKIRNINAKMLCSSYGKFLHIGNVLFDIDYSYNFSKTKGNHHIFNKKNIDVIL